jgi:lipoprotein NlpI
MKTRARDYCRRKCKEDPSWNALHQKQYRMTHPENYGMMQIRYYMKKISPERQMEILKKFGFRKEKEETPTITTNNHDNDLLNGGE